MTSFMDYKTRSPHGMMEHHLLWLPKWTKGSYDCHSTTTYFKQTIHKLPIFIIFSHLGTKHTTLSTYSISLSLYARHEPPTHHYRRVLVSLQCFFHRPPSSTYLREPPSFRIGFQVPIISL